MRTLALVALGASLIGCGSFENPEIVLDFRVLGITATPPEQLIDIDIQNPAPPVELLEQVQPTEICVLLSDRLYDRRLRWEMNVCVLTNDERCDPDAPISKFGEGFWDDPELSSTPSQQQMCDSIPADGNLLAVASKAFEFDMLRGLGGLYYGVSLRVGGENDDPEQDLWAAKTLRLMPRIPADIKANINPTLDRMDLQFVDNNTDPPVISDPVVLPFGRCRDQAEPLVVGPRTRIRLTPVEPESAREPYVVPTVDGSSRMFTESLTYQWLATDGNYSSGRTGGTRDAFGNPAILWTEWVAPDEADLVEAGGPIDVDMWFIQRDERLGLTWYESCVRVVQP